nr:hypothetical protein Iba_chr03aCG3810 [Ipomoea batatas]GMC73732.1 hypothetical protein Iba_chr03cCG3520 [Ipomoea batatas]GMC75170.1 hypothetical protein Iba_chr03dCG2490 [Ipomoea batatas]GMD78548.1 hypothetical protein Iba_chr13cCG14050 [Ipomoea batatas]
MADAIRTSCWFSEVIREAAQVENLGRLNYDINISTARQC